MGLLLQSLLTSEFVRLIIVQSRVAGGRSMRRPAFIIGLRATIAFAVANWQLEKFQAESELN